MSKRIYTEVLRHKALGYYADELIETTSDFDFLRIIARYFVPLLRRAPAFEWFYFRCIKEKDTYLKMHAELEIKAPGEVEQSFLSLRSDVEMLGLLDDPRIKQQVEGIEQIFAHKDRYGIPSYLDEVHEKQRYLLEDILNDGTVFMVKKYADIAYRSHTIWDAASKNHKDIKTPYIVKFTFAPVLPAIRELDAIWERGEEHVWVAWEYLVLVEWCWNTPFSFFEDKKENYGDYQSRNASIHLLSLHSYWVQISKIRHREDRQQNNFFNKSVFIKYLKLILNEIILEQEVTNTFQEIEPSIEAIEPYRIQPRHDGYTQLLLEVQWFEEGGTHVYVIHSFHDGLKRNEFMRDLMNAPIGNPIAITGAGGSVAKYLQDANLNNMLGGLFIERVNTKTATKLCEYIWGKDLSQCQRTELKALIKNTFSEMPDSAHRYTNI